MDVLRAVRLWGPVVLWMGAIFFLSSRPLGPDLGRIPDWVSHPAAFGAGGFLVCHALADGARPSWRRLAAAVAFTTAYGISDEYHQGFVPGRDADAGDVVKDLVGAAGAAWLYRRAAAAPVAHAAGEPR